MALMCITLIYIVVMLDVTQRNGRTGLRFRFQLLIENVACLHPFNITVYITFYSINAYTIIYGISYSVM